MRRQLRTLRIYALLLTSLSAFTLLGATVAWRNASFDIVTDHRLNVVDQNGVVRFALFNKKNEPGAMIAGKELPKSERSGGTSAGMFFFNDAGDEQGVTPTGEAALDFLNSEGHIVREISAK